MRVGIFGSDADPQCHAVARALKAQGADNLLIRSDALDQGMPLSIVDGRYVYRGVDLEDIRAFYLRSVPAPYAPAMEKDGSLVLYDDWFERYMHQRERASFYVSWLLALHDRGCKLVNPPHAASVLQYKPFQLHALRSLGAQVPRTLISNDPKAVRVFLAEVKDVIFKPLMGGAITRPLNKETLAELPNVVASPVIFQQRIEGDDLRVMLVGNEIVSCVAIQTPQQHLDFRDDPAYSGGAATYRELQLPAKVKTFCRKAARACGLHFAGIDIKHKPGSDDWVFLELNSSPIYLDVERKLGHPISAAIAKLLISSSASARR